MSQVIFNEISNSPSAKEIKEIANRIIDLFKKLQETKKSALGLWGELFLIHSSVNQLKSLEAWHNHPEDKYDFYNFNEAVEVKCTTKTSRKHIIKNDQLISHIDKHFLVSIMTRESSTGLSLMDMYQDMLKLNISDDQLMKLKLNIYLAKEDGENGLISNTKYDYKFASQNLLFFSVHQLEKIHNIPKSISDVSFNLDLSLNSNLRNYEDSNVLSNFLKPV